ncbi:Prohibitin-2 [Arachis hypogaea]|nr:Prohibitin-2 [Arachis hypogaea]
MNNVKVLNVLGGGLSALLKVSIFGGLAVYGAANSLYNVEGGHRAIVFNRIVGVKDKGILWKYFVMNFWLDVKFLFWEHWE